MVTALGASEVSEYSILELCCDGGLVGVGEVSLIWHGNGSRVGVEVASLLRQAVVGLDVLQLEPIVRAARDVLAFGRHTLTALAALEMAVLDAQGRLLGVPVYVLRGGASRDRIRLSMSLSVAPLDETITQARGFIDEGFRALKIKGLRDGEHIASVAAALRREFGSELSLRVDLNMACKTPKEVIAIAQQLEPYNIRSIEQPLRAEDLDGLAFVREHTPIPLMLDESVWDECDAARAISRAAADLVNIYVAEAGGITAGRRIADMCDCAGVEVAIGSMPELGVGTAAAAHLGFSLPHLEHPSDVAGFRYHSSDVVCHELRIVDGDLMRPTGPGLGVELDRDRLAAHAIEVGR